jgi:hypothetical protein
MLVVVGDRVDVEVVVVVWLNVTATGTATAIANTEQINAPAKIRYSHDWRDDVACSTAFNALRRDTLASSDTTVF